MTIKPEKPDRYGLIGYPVAHSLSPQIHHAFAQQTQQNLTYQLLETLPPDLAATLRQFQQQGGKGLNVTAPYKQDVIPHLDRLTERAAQAQAVNTITFAADGERVGDNTDGVGLIRDLRSHQIELEGKNILILGAGGAVSGLLPSLLQEAPQQLTITNRTLNKAQALVNKFSVYSSKISLSTTPFGCISDKNYDLIINAVSGTLDTEFLQALNLQYPCFFYELRYNQLTSFLKFAKAQCQPYTNGLGMLIQQAAESFYSWRKVWPDLSRLTHCGENRAESG